MFQTIRHKPSSVLRSSSLSVSSVSPLSRQGAYLRGMKRHRTLFPFFRHQGGGGNMAPPPMHCVRCLRLTFSDAKKEAKLHEGSASSTRRLCGVSQAFTQRYPNAVPCYCFRTSPRGQSVCSSDRLSNPQNGIRISKTALRRKAVLGKIEVFLLTAFITAPSTTYELQSSGNHPYWNTIFVDNIARKIYPLVPDYTCPA